MGEPSTPDSEPRAAASVILVRERPSGGGELEVFLLRRHRRSGFMASSFVFPGGIAEPGDSHPRVTAARELFEEAGVLLSRSEVPGDTRAEWRERVAAGADANAVLAEAEVEFDTGALHYFAHWITPTGERRRYTALFFIARLPEGQSPSFDNVETVDQVWVSPTEALERSRELRLPPPQVRTFMDIEAAAASGWEALIETAQARAARPAVILPRLAPLDRGFALLLPWDPEYVDRGSGEAHEIDADHPIATGPSRFVLEDKTWKNVYAPGLAPTDS